MKRFLFALVFGAAMLSSAEAAPCMTVTLTGTQSGPAVFRGTAGAGTLVRYGDDANNCDALRLQFDAGRGTNMRLSQVGVEIGHINAIFFTHMHNDHTEGFADILQVRWSYQPKGPKLDVVCSTDAESPAGHVISCRNFAAHIGDPFLHSGEIAQRALEDKNRQPEGPAAITNVITFEPKNEPQVVWTSGDVKVSAIRSMLTHLGPSIGAAKQGPYTIPGGPLTEASFRQAAEQGGFTGQIVVGTDLASVRLPAK